MNPNTVTAYADWTERTGRRITGLLVFSLPADLDAELTAAGREPQFQLTGSTRSKTVEARNDLGDRPFTARGDIEAVVRAAADWLGLTGPVRVETDAEYRGR